MGAAIAFSVWRLFDKRKKRAPEGTDLGRSPIWGALGVTLLGLVLGFLVRHLIMHNLRYFGARGVKVLLAHLGRPGRHPARPGPRIPGAPLRVHGVGFL